VLAKWVVVAAGALHTPALILRSKPGIFQPRLGRNLHIHPATRVIAKFPETLQGWAEVPQSYNLDSFLDEGIFIQGQFVPPAVQAPNIPGVGEEHRQRISEFGRFASFGALISDHTSGRVRANGLVTYKLNRTDTDKLQRAIAITAEIFLHAGAEEVYTGIASQPVVKTQADLARLRTLRVKAADIEMMAFHPMGTAAMGSSGLQGVTDAYGRVFGVRNLAVADTSLFPTSNRINPQLTLMALAMRNAKFWQEHCL
jgi:choline dehydrogenase-like flavoprotein